MKRFLLTVSALLGLVLISFAQTEKLTGKVLNSKNEPVVKASINIEGTNTGTTSGVDGEFTLSLAAGKTYTIVISSVNYETKRVDVEIIAGQLNEIQVLLEEATKNTLGGVTVTATSSSARKETAAALIQFQKNTNTVASVVSAEAIRRSPDRNTGEVLKRTPGASLQEGRFIVVRGLADRYNQAMMNGILLTSTEPDRKSFSFDLIPAPMIDNIIINKAFVPEFPGEWAGGLIQVNTKDIPSKSFFNIQAGTGFNSQTIGNDFYKEKRGDLDWLGIDDGARALPSSYTKKSEFDILTPAQKTAIGKEMPNRWVATQSSAPLNISFQANGGFSAKLFGKKLGGTLGVTYNKNNRLVKLANNYNVISSGVFSTAYNLNDDKYGQEITAGAVGSLSMQLSPAHKISVKSLINVNTLNAVTERNGVDVTRTDPNLKGSEFTFKQNTFFTIQVNGDHSIAKPVKLKWYGAFNILDGYIPDQRRILYSRTNPQDPYRLIISNTLSQQTGSRIYQSLSDYIYTAGGDVSYVFRMFDQKQTLKGGYMLQIKDRLYDAKLFAIYLPTDNDALRQLPADKVFAPENFGDGTGNKFGFDAIKGSTFRYLANTILNAGYLQFDNEFSKAVRIVWGLRVENYDQLVGSVKAWDPRHTYSKVTDFLPGFNATFKLNTKTNLRLSGSQTVIRPELRELSFLNIFDFELNASVQGNPALTRTKVTNADLRYELYPRPAETFSVGIFYKHFNDPIEQLFNPGIGGAGSYNFSNADKATAYGAEVEVRKKLDFIDFLKNFTLQANAAYIKSKVEDPTLKVDRTLQGQSPYLINAGLMYDVEKTGLNITVLFNRIGHRLAFVGNLDDGVPDIYEAPRSLLDLQVAKKFLNNKAEVKLNISDILNQRLYFYQNADTKLSLQKNNDAYRFARKFGTVYGISFNYSIL